MVSLMLQNSTERRGSCHDDELDAHRVERSRGVPAFVEYRHTKPSLWAEVCPEKKYYGKCNWYTSKN